MDNEKSLQLLRQTRVEVAPETFTLISLRREDWLKLYRKQKTRKSLSKFVVG